MKKFKGTGEEFVSKNAIFMEKIRNFKGLRQFETGCEVSSFSELTFQFEKKKVIRILPYVTAIRCVNVTYVTYCCHGIRP